MRIFDCIGREKREMRDRLLHLEDASDRAAYGVESVRAYCEYLDRARRTQLVNDALTCVVIGYLLFQVIQLKNGR